MAAPIASKVPHFIALDTCALSDVLHSNALIDAFVAAVQKTSSKAYVCDLALMEMCADTHAGRIFAALKALRDLCLELGPAFLLTLEPDAILEEEGAHALPRSLPTKKEGWGPIPGASNRSLRLLMPLFAETYENVKAEKAEFFQTDRTLHEFIAREGIKATAEQIAEVIRASNGPPSTGGMVINRAAELSNGRFSVTDVAAGVKRFRVTHALFHFAWRVTLANSVDPKSSIGAAEQVLGLWRTKSENKGGRGSWYDVLIAGGSAHADVFLVNDTDLRRRCEFLHARGLFKPTPMKLETFLSRRGAEIEPPRPGTGRQRPSYGELPFPRKTESDPARRAFRESAGRGQERPGLGSPDYRLSISPGLERVLTNPPRDFRDIPEADIIQRCAMPILYAESEHRDFPGVGGTCFAVRYRGRTRFLTAHHVVKAVTPRTLVQIPLSFGEAATYAEVRHINWPSPSSPEFEDATDIASMVPVAEPRFVPGQSRALDIESIARHEPFTTGMLLGVFGYPSRHPGNGGIDYDTRRAHTALYSSLGTYAGPSPLAGCHLLAVSTERAGGSDGMSGSPVLAFGLRNDGSWEVRLAGLVIRGNMEVVHFVETRYLLEMLRREPDVEPT